MRLDDMKPERLDSGLTRFDTDVKDDEGNAYRLVVLGEEDGAREAFGSSDFDISISPGGSREQFEQILATIAERVVLAGELDTGDPDVIHKSRAVDPSASSRTLVWLRPRGRGATFFRFTLRFGVPFGAVLQFSLPPVFACFGQLLPESGDPDLFLRLNGPSAPVVARSILGGTSVDTVIRIDLPFNLFTPFFDVFGFSGGITVFDFGGLRLP